MEDSPTQSSAGNEVSAESQNALSSHERKEIERKKREEEQFKNQESREASKQRKSLAWKALAVLIVAGLGYWFYYAAATAERPFTSTDIHWHTKLEMSICGGLKNLPRVPAGMSHFGNPLLHTHDDDIVHVEGRVFKKDQIMLGEFFDAINVPFDRDRFFNKKNGDLCDGRPGRVKVWVDGKESEEFRNVLAFDGQKVKIAFES